MTTGQYTIFTRIAVKEHRFIPRSRYLLHKIDGQCRCICQVVRSKGKVLNRILIQHRRSQLEHIRRLADGTSVVRTVVTLVQQRTAKLHTADGIADKRMQAGIISLHIIEVLVEYQVFRSQYSLTAHIVRIHAFPAAWDGTAMEDYHQAVFVGISQNIFIQAHHLLLVTAEEVHLQALHAALLQPFHLFLASN